MLNWWAKTWRWLRGWIGMMMLFGCGGVHSAPDDEVVEQTEPVVVVAKKEADRFVLVFSTTRLYREADESADFLQLRRVEQDVAERAELKQLVKERRERDARRDKAWDEREKKRTAQARKRARGQKRRAAVNSASRERREAQGIKRIGREVAYARKDAENYVFQNPRMRVVVLRWIADHEGWIEVETVSRQDTEAHCYGQGHTDLGQLRMRFFVRREDLLQTLRDQTVIELSTGTSVELLPGVAMVAVKGKVLRYRALVDGFEIVVSAEGYRVEERYRPSKLFEMQTTDTVFSDDALINKRLRLNRTTYLPFNPYYRLYVYELGRTKRTVFATTQTPCARYVVQVQDKDLAAAPRNAMQFDLHKSQKLPAKPYVLAGTQVFSSDGELLGEAYEDAHLGVPIRGLQRVKDVADSGIEHACFHKTFGVLGKDEEGQEEMGIDLCVKVDDVVRQELKVF